MDENRKRELMEVHNEKTTDELMSIWMANDTEDWDKEALAAVEQLLKDRGEDLPFKEREEAALFDDKKSTSVKREKKLPVGVIIGAVVSSVLRIILIEGFNMPFQGLVWSTIFMTGGLILGWGIQVKITGEKIE